MNLIDLARQMTFAYPLFELFESIKIKYFHNEKVEPILIYQMGKVGSSTVYETLKQLNIENSIYHVHYLSDRRIDNAIRTYQNLKRALVPMHLRRSKFLMKKIDIKKDKIKVITLTRDPVSRIVSEFFQNVYYFSPEAISGQNSINFDVAHKKVKDRILKYDIDSEEAASWFDKEFKEALGIDIYNFDFQKEKSYQIIKNKNIECLILKMEKLDETGIKAIKEFLSIGESGELEQSNIGSEKKFSADQKKLKDNLHFDKRTLQYIYSSKYMKHFYTDEEISSFIKKWM